MFIITLHLQFADNFVGEYYDFYVCSAYRLYDRLLARKLMKNDLFMDHDFKYSANV